MFVGLVEAEALVAQVAAGVDPAGCTPGEAAAALARFSAIERFAGGARLLLAARAAESGEWRRAGFRSAAHWLARQLGVTIFDARRILGASGALDDLPDTAEAIRQGKLSDGEAEEVADTATKAPGSEKELLDKAAEGDTTKLKAHCRRRRAAASGDEATRREKIRAGRGLRFFDDDHGAAHLAGQGLPEMVAEIKAHLRPFIDQAYHQARRDGRRESLDAYALDALVNALRAASGAHDTTTGGQTATVEDDTADAFPDERPGGEADDSHPPRPGRRPPAEVIVLADLGALRRGHTEAGDTCEIPGVGPVSVAAAIELLGEALVSLVLTDGVDINAVVRLGRHLSPEQRTALLVRDSHCAVPGCPQADHLENHHTAAYAHSGHTTLPELARVCAHHHDLITHHGYDLRGPPGHRTWHTPEDIEARAAPAA
jgi:hypothetical protein